MPKTTTRKPPANFCNYEHLGGCSDTLTHWCYYWMGEAKRRFGPSAFYCSNHAKDAGHLGVKLLTKTRKRLATADVKAARP